VALKPYITLAAVRRRQLHDRTCHNPYHAPPPPPPPPQRTSNDFKWFFFHRCEKHFFFVGNENFGAQPYVSVWLRVALKSGPKTNLNFFAEKNINFQTILF